MNTKPQFSIASPLPLDDQAQREKWILLAPLGDHPHEQGVQRVDAESLARMVRSFHSLLGRLKRAFVGRAVYLGHPDTPELARSYPDHRLYGLISQLQARDEGLFARIILTEEGLKLVQGGIRWLSPYWKVEEIGRSDQRERLYRPVELLSVGLTRRPNIQGQSLANTSGAPGLCGSSLPPMKTSPIASTAGLRLAYCRTSPHLLQSPEEIRSFVNEKRSAGLSYDEAFGLLLR
ncbi:MAG: phage protease [Verrucomicrobia bacterium]|jgi:hypothetical protein|nr:phage protease [Verrucomicrobiota bacterium]